MARIRKTRFASIAILGLCHLFSLHAAVAGPPLEKMSPAPNSHVPAALDLRPPSEFKAADGNESFSVVARRGLVDAKFASPATFRASAPVSASGHIMSPMETMAHNFQRQGLPLAKLFENKDSLVHLGLNQKGKPGLWILHKLH